MFARLPDWLEICHEIEGLRASWVARGMAADGHAGQPSALTDLLVESYDALGPTGLGLADGPCP
jgi:hypothetical protein